MSPSSTPGESSVSAAVTASTLPFPHAPRYIGIITTTTDFSANLCIDDSNDATNNGNIIQIWNCNGTDAQNWTYTASGEFIGPGGKCWDLLTTNGFEGASVVLSDCNGSATQSWSWSGDQVINSASGMCLGYQGNFASGIPLQVSDCNSSPALDGLGWFVKRFIAGGEATAGSITGPGGKCLDDNNDGLDNGNKIQLWDCNGTDAQNWTLTAWGEIHGPGGKCLDAAGGNMTNGTVAQLWDCNGTAAQQWTWATQGNPGPIWPLLGAGDKCLDASGGNTSNGTQIQIWDCNSTAAQIWSPPPVPPASTDLELLAGDIHGPGTIDGTGGVAHFNTPEGVAADAAGNVYVADTFNDTIRKISPAGVVTTLAGTAGLAGSTNGTGAAARFSVPRGVAVDAAGNVYVADAGNGRIRMVSPAGAVTTLASTAARFSFPVAVAVDGAGNVYVADDGNFTISEVSPAGAVTTLAGAAGLAGSADGTGANARFSDPTGVAVDAAGNVYVADEGNDTIRKITPAGAVTTLAGTAGLVGSANGTGAAARFDHPAGVAVDAAGNVYVADGNNDTIRKITPDGIVTTLAGGANMSGSADGTGAAARFAVPSSVAVDGAGNLYVADKFNDAIRKVTPAAAVTTLAGAAPQSGAVDGTGAAARFNAPTGVAVDGAGNAYVVDTGNSTIRKVTPAGVVTTLAGTPALSGSADGTGAAARFHEPLGIAVDGAFNVYVADSLNRTIRKITPAGVVTTLAGAPGVIGAADGPAGTFFLPDGMAVDTLGNVYVADRMSSTIRKITPAGVVSTLAGVGGVRGSTDGVGAAARFVLPQGVAVDPAGNVYVTDTGNHTIRKITPGGAVTTLAGTAGLSGSADGTGAAARFNTPTGIAVDGAGNVYVADNSASTVRKITPTGVTTTIAGVPGAIGVVLGSPPGLAAPQFLAVAGTSLVVTDSNAVLRLQLGAQ